jgi:hypothetical protein
MKQLATLLIALFFIFNQGPAASGQTTATVKVDRRDATSTAVAVLRAYAAKDLPAMAELSNADNKEIIRELIAQGESHPRWRSIFSGGRWQAVSSWKGDLGEIRYFERTPYGQNEKEYEARVQFGEATPEKVVVVTLTWEAGKWCFEDVNFPSRESFEKGSKTRPAIP